MTSCDGAQNGADVDRSLTKSEATADPMPMKQMGWQDPRPQGAPQSPPAACGSMKYQAQAAARHSAAAFASDSAQALDIIIFFFFFFESFQWNPTRGKTTEASVELEPGWASGAGCPSPFVEAFSGGETLSHHFWLPFEGTRNQ